MPTVHATTCPLPNPPWIADLAGRLGAELIETPISWVLLAGQSAWKLKKPVRLPFVDYTALAARRHFCEEEVRLNRRLAPTLYLGVARVAASADGAGPQLLPGADGPAIDYAVRMRRFPDGALFGQQLQAGTLDGADVDRLAALLADFHQGQAPAGAAQAADWGSAERRRSVALAALEGAGAAASPAERARLRDWLDAEAAALAPLWALRRQEGRVRECHGDLHLDNLVSLDGGVAAFDGIEFDAALRWIDVLDDIAFAVMDFAARGRPDLAFRLLGGWLERTGDHGGVPALRFSLVYRALVRAQVACLGGAGHEAAARRYLDAALAWTRPGQPRLAITHGLPGSGKTWASQQWLQQQGAIRLRSDVERKRLFGLGPLADSRAHGLDLYTPEANARTHARLLQAARLALGAGFAVVLDAAFLRRADRAQARALAAELGVPFSILACDAPLAVLRARLLARRGDASEASDAVLEQLRLSAEPLSADEAGCVARTPEAAEAREG